MIPLEIRRARYNEKREAKKERYAALAAKKEAEARALYERGTNALQQIPFGQPILVGHHSEKRDRAYRGRAVAAIDRSFEVSKTAEHYAAKAESAGTGGISSDDPDAIAKLEEKLRNLEAHHLALKTAAARLRSRGEPVQSFLLTNNSANIRNVKQRIERLKKLQAIPERSEIKEKGFILRENRNENRLQFIFEGKPPETAREILKANGFRWSPTNKAWQRSLNPHSWNIGEMVANSIIPLF